MAVEDPALARMISQALQASVVPRTVSSYNCVTKQYMEFCQCRNLSPFPVDAISLCGWLMTLCWTVKVGSLRMYIGGVRFTQELRGEPWVLAGNDLVRRTLRYLKRRYPVGVSVVKFPISLEVIRAMFPYIEGWPYDLTHDDKVCVAASLVGTTGFLRGGEFLVSSRSDRPVLQSRDLQLSAVDSTKVVRVKVKQPKARWWVESEIVTCWPAGSPAEFDVYDRVRRYRDGLAAKGRGWTDGPAFMTSEGVPLSRDGLVKWTAALLKAANVSFCAPDGTRMEVRAASWRAGGTRSAVQAGVTDPVIMALGRWKSDAWMCYLNVSPIDHLAASRAMWSSSGRATGNPLTRVSALVGNPLEDAIDRFEQGNPVTATVAAGLAQVSDPVYEEIEDLVDCRLDEHRHKEYLVQWKGYKELQWQPACNVDAPELKRRLNKRKAKEALASAKGGDKG